MADVTYAPESTPTLDAWADTIEELASGTLPDYRANVPAGTVLAETRTEGGDLIRDTKRESRMRAGANPLPDRVALWNLRTGRMSMVPPTIAQKRRMQGTKYFAPTDFSLRDPGLPEREPIAETCEVCAERRRMATPPAGPRPFYSISQLELHMQLMHTMAWESIQRRQLHDERREDREAMRDLIASVVAGMQPGSSVEEVTGAIDELTCEVCGKVAKNKLGLNSHMRSHDNE